MLEAERRYRMREPAVNYIISGKYIFVRVWVSFPRTRHLPYRLYQCKSSCIGSPTDNDTTSSGICSCSLLLGLGYYTLRGRGWTAAAAAAAARRCPNYPHTSSHRTGRRMGKCLGFSDCISDAQVLYPEEWLRCPCSGAPAEIPLSAGLTDSRPWRQAILQLCNIYLQLPHAPPYSWLTLE